MKRKRVSKTHPWKYFQVGIAQHLREEKLQGAAVELSQKYTDTSYIDSIRKITLLSRRPDGHNFKAVKN